MLAPGLVIWLAITWLGLVFIPMMINPTHAVSLTESRLFILIAEIALCLAVIGWGIVQIKKKSHEN